MFSRSSNLTALVRILSYVRVSGISKMAACLFCRWTISLDDDDDVTGSGYELSYISSCIHDSNETGTAIPMFTIQTLEHLTWSSKRKLTMSATWKASAESKGRISKLRRSSSNIIIMLRCVEGRNSKVRRFTSVNYTLFVSLKNLGAMAKRSNEVIIIVLHLVRVIIFWFCIINAIRYTMLHCSTACGRTKKV